MMETISKGHQFDVIIVGGGLAGLVCSIVLAQNKTKVLLLEKKNYPYHKVCGEYVSKEVLGYLQSLSFDPFAYGAADIKRLRISTPSGKSIYTGLDLGAFALSRYTMDYEFSKLAVKKGAQVLTKTRVTDILFDGNNFTVSTQSGERFNAPFVIGSWGKRETLDKSLNRSFIQSRTRYMGVKYHIHTDYPIDEIGLDNFDGGYCGIVKIESDKYNLCNFYRRPKDPSKHNSIKEYEEAEAFKNPIIKRIFRNSDFLFDVPVVINEVSFAPKSAVGNHILMCGDTAGLITPLCGNGMSMAITAAKMLTDILLDSKLLGGPVSMEHRVKLETVYKNAWERKFKTRLFWGRTIQGMFGNPLLTEFAVRSIHAVPPLERKLIKATHGKPLI